MIHCVWFLSGCGLSWLTILLLPLVLGGTCAAGSPLDDPWPVTPGEISPAFQSARKSEKQNPDDQAIADANRVLDFNPKDVPSLLGRGAAYTRKGDYGKAEEDLKRALALDPANARVYACLALLDACTRRLPQAVVGFSKAIELNPDETAYYHDRGVARAEIGGEDDAAIDDFTKALDMNPTDADSWYYRAILERRKNRNAEAIADLTKTIIIRPDWASATYTRGLVYYKSGRYAEAVKDFTRTLELMPKEAAAYYNRGLAYAKTDDLDRAIADYTSALKINPDDPDSHYNRANAYRRKGSSAEAITDYEVFIRVAPAGYPQYVELAKQRIMELKLTLKPEIK